MLYLPNLSYLQDRKCYVVVRIQQQQQHKIFKTLYTQKEDITSPWPPPLVKFYSSTGKHSFNNFNNSINFSYLLGNIIVMIITIIILNLLTDW
jgi:hypothetical protein